MAGGAVADDDDALLAALGELSLPPSSGKGKKKKKEKKGMQAASAAPPPPPAPAEAATAPREEEPREPAEALAEQQRGLWDGAQVHCHACGAAFDAEAARRPAILLAEALAAAEAGPLARRDLSAARISLAAALDRHAKLGRAALAPVPRAAGSGSGSGGGGGGSSGGGGGSSGGGGGWAEPRDG